MVLASSSDPLESLDRAEVGLRRALADGDADADPAEHGARVGHDLALLDQGFDIVGQDDDVVGLAGVDLPDEGRGQVEVADQLVSGVALRIAG